MTVKAAQEESPAAEVHRKADCFACKLVGAGGCFAGAWYALFQRARMPATNRNRHWLGAIAVGEFIRLVMVARYSFPLHTYMQLQWGLVLPD